MKKQNIGVITFHRPVNAGSFLQAYATQEVLQEKGYDPEIIDFYSTQQRHQYSKLYLNNLTHKTWKMTLFLVIYSLGLLFFVRRINAYNKDYHAFVEQHLKLTKDQYKDEDGLKVLEGKYEVYMSGSDQIWNTSAPDASDAYFLSFIKTGRKVAYGPSLGNDNAALTAKAVLLKDYSALSVREAEAANYLSKLLVTNVETVLDPTFLPEVSVYDQIEEDAGIDGKYIFFYGIGYNIRQRILVRRIAKKQGLRVITWNPQQYLFDRIFIRGVRQPRTQTPGTWISLIKNADLVLSGSFHGSVFSVLYRKRFSILSARNNRLSLFENLGLDYTTKTKEGLPKVFSHDDVDYQRLEVLRSHSYQFLDAALGGGLK